MIPAADVLRAFMLTKLDLTILLNGRLWANRTTPMPGYLPSQGPAIVFRPRGGPPLDYSGNILTISWQFKTYAEDEETAVVVDRVLFDVMNEQQAGGIYRIASEGIGQPLEEIAPPWPFVVSFWTTMMMTNFVPSP